MMCFNREWQRGFSCKNDSGQKWTKLQYLKNTALGFLMAQLVKNPPTMWETWIPSLCWEDPLEKGKGYPLQYSGLGNSLDCIVHRVAKSQTRLSDFHFTCTFVKGPEQRRIQHCIGVKVNRVQVLVYQSLGLKGSTSSFYSVLGGGGGP